MQLFYPTIAVQLDFLSSALGVAVAIAISFAAITLVASYLRFQQIVQQSDELPADESGMSSGDIIRLQLARFHDACSRKRTPFSFSLIRFSGAAAMGNTPLVDVIQGISRNGDVACVYDDETVALLAETEAEDVEGILARITQTVVDGVESEEPESFRVGIAIYPEHGLSGKELIQAALSGLEQATAETPIVVPVVETDDDGEDEDSSEEIENEDVEPEGVEQEDVDEDEETSLSYRERRELAMLDSLTQVLKPSAISGFMQRSMTEWRRNEQSSVLFSIGVNNVDDIIRLHGEEAADEVLVVISTILREQLRSTDLIGRHELYGFLVLAQCSLEDAAVISRRISTLVQQADIRVENRKIVTSVTGGVAASPEHGRNLHQLYTAAQKVLDYNRENDIRAYAVYDPAIHDKMPSKPMKSIKSMRTS